MNAREELTKKVEEIKEKYKNVINDLSMKYDKDISVAFYMLIAIPSAIVIGEKPLYETDVEYNVDELVNDYFEYLNLIRKAKNS